MGKRIFFVEDAGFSRVFTHAMREALGDEGLGVVFVEAGSLAEARSRLRACYELGRKSHRNADSTVGSVPSRSTFPAFLSRF
jgi:hypothetical protein